MFYNYIIFFFEIYFVKNTCMVRESITLMGGKILTATKSLFSGKIDRVNKTVRENTEKRTKMQRLLLKRG